MPAAVLYDQPQWKGLRVELPPGRYGWAQLRDKISGILSLQAEPGVRVTLFFDEALGQPAETFTGAVDYVGARNDSAKSVAIEVEGQGGGAGSGGAGSGGAGSGGAGSGGGGPPAAPSLPGGEAQRYYDEGYGDARAGRPARTDLQDAAGWFYTKGYTAGQQGAPRHDYNAAPSVERIIVRPGLPGGGVGLPGRGGHVPPPPPADDPPPPAYPPPPYPPPPAYPPPPGRRYPWDPRNSYEVAAFFRLRAQVGGVEGVVRKVVPYDVAVFAGLVVPDFFFILLGDEPQDWDRGYKLSGPGKTAVQLAAERLPGQSPAQHGLPAWICTMTLKGPRLLSAAAMNKVFLPGWAT